MSHPYHLISASAVNRHDLLSFILEQGGEPGDEFSPYDGSISTRSSLVSIIWDNANHAELLQYMEQCADTERGAREKQEELKIMDVIREKLGAPPQTYVHLDVLKNRASERLALRFIKAFAAKWPPAVFRNFLPLGKAESGQNVWTIEELLAFSGSHGGLPR